MKKHTPEEIEEVDAALFSEESASNKYAQNCETEYGWNVGDMMDYGRICYMQGIADFASANGMLASEEFWRSAINRFIESKK